MRAAEFTDIRLLCLSNVPLNESTRRYSPFLEFPSFVISCDIPDSTMSPYVYQLSTYVLLIIQILQHPYTRASKNLSEECKNTEGTFRRWLIGSRGFFFQGKSPVC